MFSAISFQNFIYFWLCWVFIVATSRGCALVTVCGRLIGVTSLCGAQTLGTQASVVAGTDSVRCRGWLYLLRGRWNLPGPGIETVPPCIGRGILNHWATKEVLSYYFFK